MRNRFWFGDDDQGVDVALQLGDARRRPSRMRWRPSKWNGLVTTPTVRMPLLARRLGDDRRGAGAGAAAHAGGDEHHVGAVERARRSRASASSAAGLADLGLRAGAQALGDRDAELDAAVGRAMAERLRVGVGDDELDALAAPASIMLLTALPPAPPTPITLNADVQGVDFIVADTDAQALNAYDGGAAASSLVSRSRKALARVRVRKSAAPPPRKRSPTSSRRSKARMCSPPAVGGGALRRSSPRRPARQGHPDGRCGHEPSRSKVPRAVVRPPNSGISELQQHVARWWCIRICSANSETTFKQAFEMADEVLQQGVRGITDLMVMPGLINLNFAELGLGDQRDGQGDDGHRRGRPRRSRREGHQQPAPRRCQHEGRQGRRRHHRRRGHAPDGSRRGGQPHQGTGRPRRQHHLGLGVQATISAARFACRSSPPASRPRSARSRHRARCCTFPARTATAHPAPIKPAAEPSPTPLKSRCRSIRPPKMATTNCCSVQDDWPGRSARRRSRRP